MGEFTGPRSADNVGALGRFREPAPFSVSHSQRIKMATRYWRAPRQRLLSELPNLWNEAHCLTSLLVVLTLHTWADNGLPWTRGVNIHHEKISVLSGASRRTVVSGLALLERRGLIKSARRTHPHLSGLTLRSYSLSSSLYAQKGESFASLDAPLIYGRVDEPRLPWAEMPSFAHRHLWLTRQLLQPRIYAPDAWRAAMPEGADVEEIIARREAPVDLSLSVLAEASGISRRRVATICHSVAMECS